MSVLSCDRARMLGVVAVVISHAIATAQAQPSYPVKPVRIISGFAPGGFNNSSARLIAQKLGDALGQQFIVDNRPGANGLIASDITAKSTPDGYTLFMTSAGLTTNPMLYTEMQRDPLKEFSAVSLFAAIPNVLVVHPLVPARTMKELLAIARAKPNTLTLASSGVGAPGHLTAELLQQITHARFVHIPYRGTGPALIDLIGGHVDLSFPTIATVIPHVQSGKLRALGITSAKRSPLLASVPTIGEGGVPGYEVVGWHGIVGPAGIPKDVVARLSSEIGRMVKSPDVREILLREGADPIGNTPEEFSVFLAEDLRKWTKVIKSANIRPSHI